MDNTQDTRLDKVRAALSSVDPWILFFLGCLVLLMWAIATITQIRTSELWMMGGQKMPVDVEWGVMLQPWQLITGIAPIAMTMPWCYGWFIETITLIWSLALEHVKLELFKTNKTLGSIYGSVTMLLICLNGWADYNSSPGNDPLQQALIAAAVSIMVTTGLPAGLVLLKTGLAKIKVSNGS